MQSREDTTTYSVQSEVTLRHPESGGHPFRRRSFRRVHFVADHFVENHFVAFQLVAFISSCSFRRVHFVANHFVAFHLVAFQLLEEGSSKYKSGSYKVGRSFHLGLPG